MSPIEDPERLIGTDVAILEELREQGIEYVALVANRRGLHLRHARDRCQVLERSGFVERTTDEVTYRLTARGKRYLEARADGTSDTLPESHAGEGDESRARR